MIVYRLVLTILAPVVCLALIIRVARGRDTLDDIAERLGNGTGLPDTVGPSVWLHAASNGELTAARPLLVALLDRSGPVHLVITTNSRTGRTLAQAWGLPRTVVSLAPLDYRLCLTRFLDRNGPGTHIVIENEVWLNRLDLLQRRGVRVAYVGARLSSRSARRWRRLRWLIAPLFRQLDFAAPQDDATAQTFLDLGVPTSVLRRPVTLKAAVKLTPPDAEQVSALGFVRTETVLAASTHRGEEEQVLEAFAAARQRRPDLRLILAPRHPDRAAEVAPLITAYGLRFAIRSCGENPDNSAVYLADTLGEMALWYAAAGICFVGGSLVPKGGHTPFEPAQFSCALVTGPSVENAAVPFARLADAAAVRTVTNAAGLAEALVALTASEQSAAGARAHEALALDDAVPLAEDLAHSLGLTPSAGSARRP